MQGKLDRWAFRVNEMSGKAQTNTKENEKSSSKKRPRRESTFANTHLSKDLAEIEGHHAQKALYRINLPFADCEDVCTRPGAQDEEPTDVFVFLLFSRFRSIDIKGGGVNVRFFLSLQWDTGLSGFQVANCLAKLRFYWHTFIQNVVLTEFYFKHRLSIRNNFGGPMS